MKKTPFSLDHYTEEKKEMFQQRQQSKDIADKFFNELFNQGISWVIVAGVMTEFLIVHGTSATSFEEAWNALDYQIVMDIVFRAINGLPCKNKDKGEKEAFLNQSYPRLRVIN